LKWDSADLEGDPNQISELLDRLSDKLFMLALPLQQPKSTKFGTTKTSYETQ